MNLRFPALFALACAPLLAACPQGNCIDDGFAGNQSLEACTASATAASATTTGESESDTASASASVSVSATMTMGSMSATATTTTTDGTASDSATTGTTAGGGEWCKDGDGDGHGDPDMCMPAVPGEDPPSGWVPNDDDCNDGDPNTFPGAAEKDDPEACMTDADDDGYGDSDPSGRGVVPGTDCDDSDANTFPGAAENEADANACMTDADGDGYGDSMPSGPGVAPGTDCDDADPFTFPGAAEAESPTACMRDEDGDGYGDAQVPPGVEPGADCFDGVPELSPGARIMFSVLEGGDVGEVSLDNGDVTPFITLDIAGLEGEWSVLSAAVSPEDLSIYAANAAQARLSTFDYCEGGMPSELMVHNRAICGLAFTEDGTLYGVDSNADELVTFDPVTGAVTDAKVINIEGVTVNIAACGVGFDCHSSRILVSDSLAKRILSVDPLTGAATVAATLEITPGPGLEYDPVSRDIFTNNGKTLYQVKIDGSNNYTTAAMLTNSVNDLAFGPVCQ